MTDICATPIYDRLQWEQNCFTDDWDLGVEKLFVELSADWNEWKDEKKWSFENNDKALESAQRQPEREFGKDFTHCE